MPELVYAKVTEDLIHISDLSQMVADQSSGAVVTFSGEVRNHDGGKHLASLTY